MRPWEQLTESGQFRRLRKLADRALEAYSVEPVRLRLIGGFTNVIYRVDTVHRPYALRVDLHQDHSDHDVDNEIAWLRAIAAETNLAVARPVAARDGRGYVFADAAGVPGRRRCVLFEWIPGRPLADHLSEVGYHALGRLAAGLHVHGSEFTPPHQPLTWDRVFYWPEEVDPVVIFQPEMQRFFGGGRRRVLDQAIAVVGEAFERLSAGAAQMIHGDLHPWNVHTYRNRLIAFDFEDVTWGHRVQDVATTLFYERSHDAYADLRLAYEEGYRSVAEWPARYDGEIEHFMAARSLMFVNYVANLQTDPSEYYDVVFPRLERFLADWAT